MGLRAMSLTKETKVSLGLAFVIVATVFTSTMWLTRKIDMMEYRLSALEKEQYTLAEAAEAALRLAIANPRLRVPDPRNPEVLIRVEVGVAQR